MKKLLLGGKIKNYSYFLRIQVRYKNPPHHWSVLIKKKYANEKALEHFDDFYKSVYGRRWDKMREALLDKQSHKYIAIVNNFSDAEKTRKALQNLGAHNLKNVYNISKEILSGVEKKGIPDSRNATGESATESAMDKLLADKKSQEAEMFHMRDQEAEVQQDAERRRQRLKEQKTMDAVVDDDDDDIKLPPDPLALAPVTMKSIESDANWSLERDRIIDNAVGKTASTLFEFIPPTQLKGLDDYVLESQHYGYYKKSVEFAINVTCQRHLQIPQYLDMYTYEQDNDSRFPSPQKGSTNVSDYYLLDGASVLPVLALDLQPGDDVLDMCAAPGGKSLAIMQTMLPRVLVANDYGRERMKRLHSVVREYIADLNQWTGTCFVTKGNASVINDVDVYNKILVDVPCTTDRHCLHEPENNIFRSDRIKERLQLPELQSAILTNALRIVSPGGTVVYSTCSLSPVQNEGVVKMALKNIWEQTESQMVIVDMAEALEPLKILFEFDSQVCRYGHTVLPLMKNNWGPLYFCKIKRVR